jgi:hypothetical protein
MKHGGLQRLTEIAVDRAMRKAMSDDVRNAISDDIPDAVVDASGFSTGYFQLST